jgi:hypothetical protein
MKENQEYKDKKKERMKNYYLKNREKYMNINEIVKGIFITHIKDKKR